MSETINSVRPYIEKRCLNVVIVRSVVVCDITITSAHLEYAVTIIKNDFSNNGPVKSMLRRYHGQLGQLHGCKGAFGGDCFTVAHSEHDLAMAFNSRSISAHHTWFRASPFILEMPKCSQCSLDFYHLFKGPWNNYPSSPQRQPSSMVSSAIFK